MEIEFVLPTSSGEWMAWLTAFGCLLTGLWLMVMPKTFLDLVNLFPGEGRREGFSEIRGALGGFRAGIGAAALILHPQPLIYLTIGFAFAFAVLGRLIALVFNRAISAVVICGVLFECLCAYFALGYALGWTT